MTAALRDDLRLAAARDFADYPRYVAEYSTWRLGVITRRIWRFGRVLAERGEHVLMSPDGTRFYSTAIRCDAEIPGDPAKQRTVQPISC